MKFTAERMADDILKGLRKESAPERILIEAYLETAIRQIKKEAVDKYIEDQNSKEPEDYKPGY